MNDLKMLSQSTKQTKKLPRLVLGQTNSECTPERCTKSQKCTKPSPRPLWSLKKPINNLKMLSHSTKLTKNSPDQFWVKNSKCTPKRCTNTQKCTKPSLRPIWSLRQPINDLKLVSQSTKPTENGQDQFWVKKMQNTPQNDAPTHKNAHNRARDRFDYLGRL